ncbi:hypothetical protein MMC17_001926 [Xylographa soralifera]|nr:hypothetical protein [Xylographa soralifera]
MSCLLSSPRLAAAVYGCFTHTTLIAAFDAILPLFVKRTFGWTSTGAGLIFLAITIPSLLGVVFGALSDRYGPKIVSLIGFAITIPALACLGLVTGPVLSQQALLVVLLAIIGIGLNTLLAPLAADMFYEVDILAEQNPETFGKAGAYAQAYSLFDGALGFATFVGPAWGGLFYEKASWGVCMLTLAGFAAFGVIPVWKFTGGGKMGRGNDEDGEC